MVLYIIGSHKHLAGFYVFNTLIFRDGEIKTSNTINNILFVLLKFSGFGYEYTYTSPTVLLLYVNYKKIKIKYKLNYLLFGWSGSHWNGTAGSMSNTMDLDSADLDSTAGYDVKYSIQKLFTVLEYNIDIPKLNGKLN